MVAESVSDTETLRAIRDTYVATGRILCPHTAVGLVARRRHARFRPAILLATAHPGKFPDVVREATGEEVQLPEPLQRTLEERRDPIDVDAHDEALRTFLRSLERSS